MIGLSVNEPPAGEPESGRTPPRLYTREEAVILGRRSLCEGSSNGHRLGLTMRSRNATGERTVERYTCSNCDVRVRLDYPPLGR